MNKIPRYDFYKHKYGDELLIDVVRLADIKKYIKECPVHTLAYYDITLITEGKGRFSNDRIFLRNLSYFSTDRTSVKMSLDDDTYNQISKLILEIRREIDHYQTKSNHLLRALLYETPSYFIRQFRKQTSMTPLSYRKATKP